MRNAPIAGKQTWGYKSEQLAIPEGLLEVVRRAAPHLQWYGRSVHSLTAHAGGLEVIVTRVSGPDRIQLLVTAKGANPRYATGVVPVPGDPARAFRDVAAELLRLLADVRPV